MMQKNCDNVNDERVESLPNFDVALRHLGNTLFP